MRVSAGLRTKCHRAMKVNSMVYLGLLILQRLSVMSCFFPAFGGGVGERGEIIKKCGQYTGKLVIIIHCGQDFKLLLISGKVQKN